MKTIVINNFARGMADDRYAGYPAEFSITKHFDILTNPRRLQPLRGMTTHTASTGIGNIIVASNGSMYGVGLNGGVAATGKLWYQSGYGTSDNFTATNGSNQTAGAAVAYDFLVDYPDAGNVRTIHWAVDQLLLASSPQGAGSANSQALTYTYLGQGFVHPKTKILYIPYYYATTPLSAIASVGPNATSFANYSPTALTLPNQYRSYCLTHYGNLLAIPATSVSAGSNVNASKVFLWDMSATTWNDDIPWGDGFLKVLNNLNGTLIGISELGSDTVQAETPQDYNAIVIKVYDGGVEPRLIKEIKAFHLAGSNRPSVVINPRVNFIKNNRLYFSISVNPNDGISPAYYGLWSVGKNKLTGEWAVTMEHVATNDNSETGVIAAAAAGDYIEMVHTAEGTLTRTTSGATSSTTYGATSVYESVVNPEMSDHDKLCEKTVEAAGVATLPLSTGQQVVLKVRVDSNGSVSDWKTIFTKTATSPDSKLTSYETSTLPAMAIPSGRNLEFRLESTGGAVITSFFYKYKVLPSLI